MSRLKLKEPSPSLQDEIALRSCHSRNSSTYDLGKTQKSVPDRTIGIMATALAVRDRVVDIWMNVARRDGQTARKSASIISRSNF